MAPDDETIFRNTSQGYVGAVKVSRRGEKEAVAVEPGGTVALTDEEQELTARAPRNPKDNPFVDQPYQVLDPENGEVVEEGTRPLLVPDTEERFIPGQAGTRDDREETGTTTAGSTRGRRTSGKSKSRRATPVKT